MAIRTLKKWKIWIFKKNLKILAKCRKFLKIQIFNFFRVLLAIKLNSKTYLRSAIFLFRTSFLEKMQKFWQNCSPWPNKSEREVELQGAESLGLWVLKFWILWKIKNRFLINCTFWKTNVFFLSFFGFLSLFLWVSFCEKKF